MPEEIRKLSNGLNMSWLVSRLSSAQLPLIKEDKQMPGFFQPGNLGYLDPSQVVEYFSSIENRVYPGSPQLRVYIDFEGDWQGNLAGRYFFMHPLKEKHSIMGTEDFILNGFVSDQDVIQKRVDPKYVKEDNSGRIIPVTIDRVEKAMQFQEKRIRDPDSWPTYDFRDAEKLARIVGIDISGRVKALEAEAVEKHTVKYSSPENLGKVLGELEEQLAGGFIVPIDDDDLGDYDGNLRDFLSNIGKVRFPEGEFKRRAVAVLRNVSEGYDKRVDTLQEGLAKKIKEQQDVIDSIRGEKVNLLAIAQKISQM